MSYMEYNFKYKMYTPASEKAAHIAQQCGISPIIAAVLLNRGVDTEGKVNSFINKTSSSLHDPFLLADMDRAVSRIKRAVLCKEKITVYGDYDADGITATAILLLYFREKNMSCDYYIPDREEGYGLHSEAIEQISKSGTDLIITVDTGITATEEVEYAKSLGLDIIVTDHHLCTSSIPDCIAIDPQRPDCPYPFKSLAGVGVAFKLLCALEEGSSDDILKKYSDLVALGTVADMMDLTDENRAIVSSGLEKFASSPNPGLKLLMAAAGTEGKRKDTTTLGFTLAPRINAAGRMSSPHIALELIINEDKIKQQQLCDELENLNTMRRKAESDIEKEACSWIENKPMYKNKKVYVLANTDWQAGVLGIAASNVAGKYNRPCILLTCENGIAKGSARSAGTFNLYEAMNSCSDLFDKFGGHEFAAGLTLAEDKIPEFTARINEYAEKNMDMATLTPVVDVEFDFPPEYYNISTINSLDILKPFGPENPSPVFAFCGAKIQSIVTMGEQGNHIKIQLDKDGKQITVIAFNRADLLCHFETGDIVDVAGTFSVNEWKDRFYPQMILSAIKPSPRPKADPTFTREQLGMVYKYLKSAEGTKKSASLHARIIEKAINLPFDEEKFINALEIFTQLKLVTYTVQDSVTDIFVFDASGKVNLEDSPLFCSLQAQKG